MTEQKAGIPQKKSNRKRLSVLVADHAPYSLSCVSILLGRFGYHVLKATTGKEAVAVAKRDVPCLILIAVDLPDVNVFDLMHELTRNSATLHIPLIGLMQQHDRNIQDRCFELGAVGCLWRPIKAETLYRTVQVAMEKNPRASIRVRTVQPVKVYGQAQESLYGAYTLALSDGGMFLRTMNPLSVNTELSLELNLNGRTIAADAVVLYNCQAGCGPDLESGIGLRFVDIAPRDQDFIRQFIWDDIMKGIALAGN